MSYEHSSSKLRDDKVYFVSSSFLLYIDQIIIFTRKPFTLLFQQSI